MSGRPLRILQVNTLDQEGGAEQIAWSLFQGYRALGQRSWLAVGVKRSSDTDVLLIRNRRDLRNPWAWFWWAVQERSLHFHGYMGPWGEKLRRVLAAIAEPRSLVDMLRGYENSYFSGTRTLLELPPERPDLLHCHSLQRGYFDLEALSDLSAQVPTVLTLHDAWLLSGHCTHSLGCDRWRIGCGNCPNLTIPPAVLRDGTARNWQRKQAIFARSRLWVATPSQWLMNKVQESMLQPVGCRVIPHGVDLETFAPGEQAEARAILGLPAKARILLFVAHRARRNPWKDYQLLGETLVRLGTALPGEEVLLLGVGDTGPNSYLGSARLQWVGYQSDPARLALYYRAADVYLYPVRVDTFPNVVLEALACGTPVVATRVGGIPEQIEEGRTGFTTPAGEAKPMAHRVTQLLTDETLRRTFSAAAAATARQRFDVKRMVADYLDWYREILAEVAHEQYTACLGRAGHLE